MYRKADETEASSDYLISMCLREIRTISIAIAAAVIIAASGYSPASGQRADGQTEFNIPSQPLSRALLTYGTVTGLEIFYNAALADNQHSTAVVGVLTPSAALQILLRGTGYAVRPTGAGAFTITWAPRETTTTSAESRRRLQPYFAMVQSRMSDVFCGNGAVAGDKELLFQFWLSPSGVILSAQVINEDGQPAQDQSYAAAIRGLALAAPPAGLAQPINMVIFPASASSRACGLGDALRRAERHE